MLSNDDRLSRRRLLRLGSAAGIVTGIAGCLGGDTDENGEDENGDEENGGEENGDENGGAEASSRPVVFVHGSSGSATQFESQAMRFASNGYPDDYLWAYEYDTSVELDENETEVLDGLEAFIGDVIESTDADEVDVLGHSRGTRVMHRYLASERAAPIANYVNIDGATADSQPGDVPTLALWADYGIGAADAEIGGAENVSLEQAHIEIATSEEAFAAIYEFLTDVEPETTTIEPEPADEVTLAGRAAYFPLNVGIEDATLEVYEVDAETGERLRDDPDATPTLEPDGSWGPIDVDGEAYYEFVLDEDAGGVTHFYRQPAVRSNQFVRLLTSVPGEGIDAIVERDPDHAALVVNRDVEWWGDTDERDSLTVDGTDVVTAATAPREDWISSVQVYDADADGETNADGPIPVFQNISFLTGVDVHVPASDPPDDTVTIASTPRTDGDLTDEFAVRNWPSDDHRVSVRFPDHSQRR